MLDLRPHDEPHVEAARLIAEALYSALATKGKAVVALSGGRTPKPMLEELATAEIPWDLVRVLQVDERIVPSGSGNRNLDMLLHTLGALDVPPAIEPVRIELGPEKAAEAYNRRVDKVLEGQPIDVVHLGLGEDGHTASLFPGEWQSLPPAAVAATEVHHSARRVTLAVRHLATATDRVVLATGIGKADALSRVGGGDPTLPWSVLPSSGTVWVVDHQLADAVNR